MKAERRRVMGYAIKLAKMIAFSWVILSSSLVFGESKKLLVVASIRPLALVVEELAGDLVEVETLLPPNADPHNMALKISERTRLEQADLVIWLGPQFERFLEKTMATRTAEQQLILGELQNLRWPPAAAVDEHDGGRDMHLWLDPENGKAIIQAVFDHLVTLRPDLKPQLAQRLQTTLATLSQTNSKLHQRLQPLSAHGFAVDHNGYLHFVNAFGLKQLAAVSDVSGQSMSAKQRFQLQQRLEGASCLLAERATPTNQRLAEAAKVPLVVADPLANNLQLHSYTALLAELGEAFYRCLAKSQ